MYRLAIKKLFRWKEKPNRKPLIIEGARQVGKTWLMKEFGEKAYNKTICYEMTIVKRNYHISLGISLIFVLFCFLKSRT